MRRRVRHAAVLAAAFLLGSCANDGAGPTTPQARAESAAGSWRTWIIQDGASLLPPPPPAAGSAEEKAEIAEILSLQAKLGDSTLAEIRRWDGLPTSAWTDELLAQQEHAWILVPEVVAGTPVRAARAGALMHAAVYDALVATWNAKYRYDRQAPFRADSRVRRRAADDGGVPSYPSEHAAAAAAAAAVLAYAFPQADSAALQAEVRRAGESRIAAGMNYRSDVEAGWAIGRAVAARAIALAQTDGSAVAWDGRMPDGTQYWRPTPPRYIDPPFDPLAGTWRPWVLQHADELRIGPPPAMTSARFQEDLAELRRLNTTRTPQQADIARYWATDPPSLRWSMFLESEIASHGLGPMHAARAHALLSIAMYDAFLACWDSKYYYWLLRPVTADSTVKTVFSTPPFPSYPSGHSTQSAAAAEVMAYLFPERAAFYHDRADEASVSRVYGAVHYRFDIEAGEALGRAVGRKVVEHAHGDGVEP